MHFVLFCCLRQNEQNYVLLFDKNPNKIWILLTKYGFFVLLFWYKIAKYFLILLVYWFFTFCSVLLFSRTELITHVTYVKTRDYTVFIFCTTRTFICRYECIHRKMMKMWKLPNFIVRKGAYKEAYCVKIGLIYS